MLENRTILLVEHRADISDTVSRTLGPGYGVVHAGNGDEAVEIISGQEKIDLALIDIDLSGGLDGPGTARSILSVCQVPIVFIIPDDRQDAASRMRGVPCHGCAAAGSLGITLVPSIEAALGLFKANAETASRQERYRLLVENLNDVVFETDLRGVMNYVSPSIEKISQYRAEEITGRNLADFIHPEDLPAAMKKFADTLGGDSSPFEFRVINRDSSIKHVRISTSVIWRDGQAVGTTALMTDISAWKQAEAEIRESGEKFFKAFENSPLVVTISTIDEGRFLEVNRAFEKTFGYTRAETLGRTSAELGLYAETGQRDALIRTLREKGALADLDVEVRTKDGQIIHALGYMETIEFNNTRYLLISMIDITERELIKKALRESEEKFRFIVENSMIPMIISSFPEGSILFYNASAADLFEIPEDSGKLSTTDFWNSRPERDTLVEILKREKSVGGYEAGLKTRGGNDKWFLLSARLIRFLGREAAFTMFDDVTERKRMEEALRASEYQNRLLVETVNAGILITTLDGRFVQVNPAVARMAGYDTAEELMRMSAAGLYARPEDRKLLIGALLENGSVEDMEIRSRKKDGTQFWISINAVLMKDEDGDPCGLIGVIFDITERKRAKERVQELLAEKELLVKEVHHRIKNNMNSVMGLLSMQASRLKDSSAVEALKDARGRIHSMAALYDRLYRSENVREIRADEYIPSLLDQIARNFPNCDSVRIETKIDGFTLPVKAVSPLGIILNELLTNAMKHAFPDRAGTVAVSATAREGRAVVVFEDDGVGFPDTIKVDEPSGFGLELVDMLAQQLHGSVTLERVQGARFTVEFVI